MKAATARADLDPAEPQLPHAAIAHPPGLTSLAPGRARDHGPAPRVIAAVLGLALAALIGIGWGLGELSRSVAQGADFDVVRDVAAGRTSFLTTDAHALSWAGSGFVVFPLAAVCCAVLLRLGRRRAALAVVASAVGAVVIANLDKLLVGRPRPPVRHLEHVISSSSPSGHATQAAALYTVLLLVFLAGRPARRAAVAAVLGTVGLVIGIALSRVYLGVHYPTDTAAGVLLGGSWGVLASSLLLRRTNNRSGLRR